MLDDLVVLVICEFLWVRLDLDERMVVVSLSKFLSDLSRFLG